MSNISEVQFLLNISKQDLIDILESPNESTEIEELDAYINKISAIDIIICLKFLKKDADGLGKLKPKTIQQASKNTNAMLELVRLQFNIWSPTRGHKQLRG